MGMWCLVIQGVGAHHNQDYPGDADKVLAEVVDKLKAAGHTVEHASITYGGRETTVTDPVYTRKG